MRRLGKVLQLCLVQGEAPRSRNELDLRTDHRLVGGKKRKGVPVPTDSFPPARSFIGDLLLAVLKFELRKPATIQFSDRPSRSEVDLCPHLAGESDAAKPDGELSAHSWNQRCCT